MAERFREKHAEGNCCFLLSLSSGRIVFFFYRRKSILIFIISETETLTSPSISFLMQSKYQGVYTTNIIRCLRVHKPRIFQRKRRLRSSELRPARASHVRKLYARLSGGNLVEKMNALQSKICKKRKFCYTCQGNAFLIVCKEGKRVLK